jgi:hypothetical protein
MPLNEIPKYFNPETRSLIDSALEEAWQELSKDSYLEAAVVQPRLRRTIVALASVGETDPRKLKRFAIHAPSAPSTIASVAGRAMLTARCLPAPSSAC